MLAHLGCVTLPPNVLAKLDAGRPLTEDETDMVARVPETSRTLVASIPRLEDVADAIGRSPLRYDGLGSPLGAPKGDDLPLASRVLRVAVDFDSGISQRPSVQDTLAVMTTNAGAYDPEVLRALMRCHDSAQPHGDPVEIGVNCLEAGMVIFDDIHTAEDVLLISRGTVVTEALVVRLENYARHDRVSRIIRVLR
jgi:HD-GYP domain-containing protein (c-di-GMP phosphodiesterase class II)